FSNSIFNFSTLNKLKKYKIIEQQRKIIEILKLKTSTIYLSNFFNTSSEFFSKNEGKSINRKIIVMNKRREITYFNFEKENPLFL
ncbi:MAG: hypothetical protein ACTSO8_07610, partial [Promethearchaeota archaeon]